MSGGDIPLYHWLIVFQWPKDGTGWGMATMDGTLPATVRTRTEAMRHILQHAQEQGVPSGANITFLSLEPEDL